MSAFSSNETVSITRTVDIKPSEQIPTPVELLGYLYEINRCTSWIAERGPKKVCLQFPDSLLHDSVEVALHLEKKIGRRVFILGDTSYGSCCVDEVAAEHVGADAVIHFGHACLSPTKRLPVLYVFQKKPLDVCHFVSSFKETFVDASELILLLYDVAYAHHVDAISADILGEYENCVVSRLYTEQSIAATQDRIKFGRILNLKEGSDESDYNIVFIGEDGRTLTNFALTMSASSFRQYDPGSVSPSLNSYDVRKSKFLMSRLYLVEKVKDAKTLGIVVGTLGVSNYLDVIDRIKKLVSTKGKKCYIFAVGKPNVAKLANFPEIEAFVLIACPENSQIDSKEFYRPVVTPFEVELACNSSQRSWSENYITDFRELLPGGKHHVEVNEMASDADEVDVSLITGLLRHTGSIAERAEDVPSNAVSLKGDLAVSGVLQSGSEFLLSRSWRGLQQDLGQTEVKMAEKGQSGIPQAYTSDKVALQLQPS